MTLRHETLRDEILVFLAAAKDIEKLEDQQRHFAAELAKAVDRFVRSGDVVGVTTALAQQQLPQVGAGRVT